MTHCPWCSAELPAGTVATCPSCGATLASATGIDPDIRGVTTLDHEAILRARSDIARPRSRLLSFITGDVSAEAVSDPSAAESLAPPAEAVRREMRRLQLEAERAALEAESVALKSDVVVEQGIDLASLADDGGPAGEAGPVDAGSGTPGDQAPGDQAAGPRAAPER